MNDIAQVKMIQTHRILVLYLRPLRRLFVFVF